MIQPRTIEGPSIPAGPPEQPYTLPTGAGSLIAASNADLCRLRGLEFQPTRAAAQRARALIPNLRQMLAELEWMLADA